MERTESAKEEDRLIEQELLRLRAEEAAEEEAAEAAVRQTLAERAAREAEAERRRREEEEKRREEDAKLAAVAAAKAERVRAKLALERKLLRRQGKADQLPPLFLREMSADEVVDFVDACVDWLVRRHRKRYKDAAEVFGGSARRLVENIVLSLSRNRVDRHGRVQLLFNLFVNGDPQRGKSNVEAVMTRIVNFIDKSPLVKDKCYSLLGSVMVGWAESLFANTRDLRTDLLEFKKEARAKEGRRAAGAAGEELDDDGSDSDDEPTAEEDVEDANIAGGDASEMRAGLVLGKKGTPDDDKRLMEVAMDGGVLVFPRNVGALKRVNKLVHDVWSESQKQPEAERIAPVHFVFLDEADQMRGSTAESAGETNRSELYKYEQQLMHLFGRKRCSNVAGNAREPLLVPPLVVDISATNQLCFLDLILRLEDPTRKLLDVLSFTEDKTGYAGLDKCVAFKMGDEEVVLEPKQLTVTNHHADDTVISWYKDVISKPNACGLVVASNRVTADHNMDQHFQRASQHASEALRKEGKRMSAHVGVIVHGGESRYEGCMGIYLCGSTRELNLSKVDKALRALDLPSVVPKGKCPKTGEPIAELCAKDLRPLMEKLDGDNYNASLAPGSAPYKLQLLEPHQLSQTMEERERDRKRAKLSSVHLGLLLALLRHHFEATPIFIIGHGMVRRCLSLVGVDYESGKLKTTLVVTHMFIWATPAANGSGVIQQAGRCCTTLVDFRNRDGNTVFQEVQVLAPELVWNYIRGGLAFNGWFGRSEPGMSAAEARDKIVKNIEDAQECWKANGGNNGGFARAVVAHLEMPEEVLTSLSGRGAVPSNARRELKLLRDNFATVGLRNENASFGVIEVLNNMDPEVRETELRLLFRTAAYLDTATAATQTEWMLGELPFESLEERGLAKHSGALVVTRAVNAYLDGLEPDTPWETMQQRCRRAFEGAKRAAQPLDGKFTTEATTELARIFEQDLLPQADDGNMSS